MSPPPQQVPEPHESFDNFRSHEPTALCRRAEVMVEVARVRPELRLQHEAIPLCAAAAPQSQSSSISLLENIQ